MCDDEPAMDRQTDRNGVWRKYISTFFTDRFVIAVLVIITLIRKRRNLLTIQQDSDDFSNLLILIHAVEKCRRSRPMHL